jgi:hypothetical protein
MFESDAQMTRPYVSKIAECYALCDASDDPLVRAVYRAMASEFESRAREEPLYAQAR